MVLHFQRPQACGACKLLLSTVLTLSITTIATSVQAITFVTERTALDETDRVNWSAVGEIFNPFGPPDPAVFLPNSFPVQSKAGLDVQVTIPEEATPGLTPPFVFQTTPAPGIETNFGNGDFILFSGFIPGPPPAIGNPGPITLTFDTPVLGAGAQIGVDDTFDFTATLSAFDADGTLLGSFSAVKQGKTSLDLDNSALFLGVLNDLPIISKLEFKPSVSERAIGINQLSIVAAATAVPEPATGYALMLITGMGLLGQTSRRRNHNA